jgi:hypothetical protein
VRDTPSRDRPRAPDNSASLSPRPIGVNAVPLLIKGKRDKRWLSSCFSRPNPTSKNVPCTCVILVVVKINCYHRIPAGTWRLPPAVLSLIEFELGGLDMRYSSYAAFCAGMIVCSAASAATVDSIEGRVLLNRGDGFQVLTVATTANPRDKVMASPDGSAKLRYADGCVIDIRPGAVVSVGEKSPCTAPYLGGLEGPVVQERRFPFLLVGAGIAGLTFAVLCISETEICEDEGEGRRRRRAQVTPASP